MFTWLGTKRKDLKARRVVGERLKERYRAIHGRDLNIKNPQTFSEKLYCRMIAVNNFGDPLMTRLSDKLRVRSFVGSKIGEEHLSKLIWHGTDPHAIPFDALPPTCMIKVNHWSGDTIPVRGEVNKAEVIEKLANLLSRNYYDWRLQFQYRDIEPCIMIEEMLDDGNPDGPYDYRFWCFDGRVEMIQVDNYTHSINPFYDPSWVRIKGGYRKTAREVEVERPQNLDELLRAASTLSSGLDFVRVDLYNLKDRFVFGEMTFTPVGGTARFDNPAWEDRLGRCWKLRLP